MRGYNEATELIYGVLKKLDDARVANIEAVRQWECENDLIYVYHYDYFGDDNTYEIYTFPVDWLFIDGLVDTYISVQQEKQKEQAEYKAKIQRQIDMNTLAELKGRYPDT